SATAAGVRMFFVGAAPAFAMSAFAAPDGVALSAYVFLGAVIGLFAAIATRAVYDVEDAFERLPIHWMWWPAIGGIAVGIIGYFFPKTMGVGYDNINMLLSGQMAMRALAFLCVMKFVSWAIALGSGTSGGTLAPLFTIGGALGGALGIAGHHIFPDLGID